MNERTEKRVPALDLPARWEPESLTAERLSALLPYTELDTVEAFRDTLARLETVLAKLPREHSRHLFVPRRGGPHGTESVLHLGGRILGNDLTTVVDCLELLGLDVEPIDALDRELVVATARGRTTLGMLGLIAGYDPDSDDMPKAGANWAAYANALMQEAASADASNDTLLGYRTHRSFPLKGDSRVQRLHPLLKRYFSDAVRPTTREIDPVALDELIDETADRFEAGEIDLNDAFGEMGLESDEHVPDSRMTVPANAHLGERLTPSKNPRYRWTKGTLYRRGATASDAEPISSEELTDIYRRARPVAALLWEADMLRRKAARIPDDASAGDLGRAERFRAEAAELQKTADSNADGLRALSDATEINTGYVFVRVMRFLKRRDVQMAGSYGPHDLMQEGMIGLYNAIAHYDPDSNDTPFTGFARFRVDGNILRYAVEHRSFASVPVQVQQTLNKLYDIEAGGNRLGDTRDSSADPDSRRARRFALAESIFGQKYNTDWFLDSLSRETHHPDSTTMVKIEDLDAEDDSIVDMNAQDLSKNDTDATIAASHSRDLLSQILTRCLTPREERVLRLRFGVGPLLEQFGDRTLDETAEFVPSLARGEPLSRERMRQMEAKALRKLKRHLYLRFGRRDKEGTKYIDMETIARVFDIPGYR